MKKLLPRSLAGQLLLVVAAALFIAQAINMFLLYRGAQNQNLIEASTAAVSRIVAETERLNDPFFAARRERFERRPRFRRNRPLITDNAPEMEGGWRAKRFEQRATQAFDSMGIDLRNVRVMRFRRLPSDLTNSVIGLRPLRQRLRDVGYRGGDLPVDGFIAVSGQMRDDRWITVASAIRARDPLMLRGLLVQTIVIYALILIPLLWFGRRIARPLGELTSAARHQMPGQSAPVEQRGPPDMRDLVSAFNDMNQRVDAMLNEKDVMLGAIGHDLRTPLAALRVRVESVEDSKQRQQMVNGIDEMERMLDDILSLARLGRTNESPETTDITALVETVTAEFEELGGKVMFIRGERIVSRVRPGLIRRALRNLIENALKYGKQADVDLIRDGDDFVLKVADEGPGIPEDQLDTMFEPFVRGDKSRNRATGGSGLGLTLARAIARQHGGDLTLRNREQGGLEAELRVGSLADRSATPA